MASEPVGVMTGGQSHGELLSDVYGDLQEQTRDFADDVRNASQSFVTTVRNTVSDIFSSPQNRIQQEQRSAGQAAPSTTGQTAVTTVTAPSQISPVEKSSCIDWWGWVIIVAIVILLLFLALRHKKVDVNLV